MHAALIWCPRLIYSHAYTITIKTLDNPHGTVNLQMCSPNGWCWSLGENRVCYNWFTLFHVSFQALDQEVFNIRASISRHQQPMFGGDDRNPVLLQAGKHCVLGVPDWSTDRITCELESPEDKHSLGGKMFFWYFMCPCMPWAACGCPRRPEGGIGSPKTAVTDGHEPLNVGAGNHTPGPL